MVKARQLGLHFKSLSRANTFSLTLFKKKSMPNSTKMYSWAAFFNWLFVKFWAVLNTGLEWFLLKGLGIFDVSLDSF